MRLLGLVLGASILMLSLWRCGKKDDDTSSSSGSTDTVAKLSITCNGKACVGTEAQ